MRRTIEVLNDMVGAGVVKDYAIGGAIAMAFYVEPQETADLDIYVVFPESTGSLTQLTPAYSYLEQRGHHPHGEHVSIHGVLVQFLGTDELTEDALVHAEARDFYGVPTKVLSKEHLAVIMVRLQRPKDRARLPSLLELPEFDRARFEVLLDRFDLQGRWSILHRRLYE